MRKDIMKMYMCDAIKEATKNPIRFNLTFWGLFFCITALIVCFFVNDALEKKLEILHLQIEQNEIYISGEYDPVTINTIADGFPGCQISCTRTVATGSQTATDGFKVNYTLYSVWTNASCSKLPSVDETTTLMPAQIIAGRAFNEYDRVNSSPVAILPKVLYNLFWGDTFTPQTIKIAGTLYEVIGVIANTPDINRILYRIENDIQGNTDFPIYTLSSAAFASTATTIIFPYIVTDKLVVELSSILAKDPISPSFTYSSNIHTRLTVQEKLKYFADEQEITSGMIIAIIVLSIVLTIMLMLFSVKEKITAFAIRKAVDARSYDIWTHLTWEMLIIFFFSSIIASTFGYLLSYAIVSFISIPCGTSLFVNSINSLLLPTFIVLTIVCAVTTITSIIISRIKVIDMLKFSQ
ncbi:MAG: hypothetical protein LBE09_01190 [Christensenellaceae bacterium]|jgi:ABC-type antimicrobial peptide transport system permease subunit|nr:hypothetical protein [Christensenellaceae bacterium]